MIQLVLSLLLSPDRTRIEPLYFEEFPLEHNKQNVAYVLGAHLNHSTNAHLIPALFSRAQSMGKPIVRILKLTVNNMFNSGLYYHRRRLVSGAYGTIYMCHPPNAGEELVVKLIDMPKAVHDRCMLQEVFNEIAILEKFELDPKASPPCPAVVTDWLAAR